MTDRALQHPNGTPRWTLSRNSDQQGAQNVRKQPSDFAFPDLYLPEINCRTQVADWYSVDSTVLETAPIKRLLIVDESKATRVIVRRALRQANLGDHPVDEATNGGEALLKLRGGPFDSNPSHLRHFMIRCSP